MIMIYVFCHDDIWNHFIYWFFHSEYFTWVCFLLSYAIIIIILLYYMIWLYDIWLCLLASHGMILVANWPNWGPVWNPSSNQLKTKSETRWGSFGAQLVVSDMRRIGWIGCFDTIPAQIAPACVRLNAAGQVRREANLPYQGQFQLKKKAWKKTWPISCLTTSSSHHSICAKSEQQNMKIRLMTHETTLLEIAL